MHIFDWSSSICGEKAKDIHKAMQMIHSDLCSNGTLIILIIWNV